MGFPFPPWKVALIFLYSCIYSSSSFPIGIPPVNLQIYLGFYLPFQHRAIRHPWWSPINREVEMGRKNPPFANIIANSEDKDLEPSKALHPIWQLLPFCSVFWFLGLSSTKSSRINSCLFFSLFFVVLYHFLEIVDRLEGSRNPE